MVLAGAPQLNLAQANKPMIDPVESNFDFVEANGGTIFAEQIPAEDCKKFHVRATAA